MAAYAPVARGQEMSAASPYAYTSPQPTPSQETISPASLGRSTLRRFESKTGNFVLNVPASRALLQDAAFHDREEFTHTSYTAVTCDPDDFAAKYDLRARRLGRQIKVALVMTMYNEDDALFIKSMLAVQKNIAYMCSDQCPYSWGSDGWKNFVVVIVSDGRTKINPRVLTVLGVMGIYVDGLPRSSVNGEPVAAHVFEFTSQIAVDRDLAIRTRKQGIVPTQTIFILKEKNAKKINSHKWFFNAVCEVIQPDVTMLLDVGTKPSNLSLYHLYRAFERDPYVGGACGEIAAELGKNWYNLLNPLVATQNFEYKMSNILDKPLESVCGYISVLPGAFSAYRYRALLGEPLFKYFLGEKPGANIFTSNLYLAEDRILCFELVTKKHEAWRLKYVKSARAETDVPDKLPELISQRRRWLNGSFFAALYALTHFSQIYQSPHSPLQKFIFTLEFIYNAINVFFSWISLANFYLTFYFLFRVAKNANPGSLAFGSSMATNELIFQIVREFYIFSIIAIFISSLSNRPQGSKWLYYVLSIMFSVIMALMLYLGGFSIYQAVITYNNVRSTISFWAYFNSTTIFRDLVVSTVSTYGVYIISSTLHLDPWHCFTSMFQYMLLLPTYVNIFMIYAFCNLHDVSWGTKGDNTVVDDKPAVAQKAGNGEVKQVFEIEIPTEPEEADAAWSTFSRQLSHNKANPVTEESKVDPKTRQEDECKEFRTRVVLSWIICNTLLIVCFTNDQFLQVAFRYYDPTAEGLPAGATTNPVNPYLTFLFWSVASLSAVRFVGCVVFIIQWWGEKVAEAGRAIVTPTRSHA